jgi:hypothetical protein
LIRAAGALIAALGILFLAAPPAAGSVVLRGKVYDGAESARILLRNFQQGLPAGGTTKSPLANLKLRLELHGQGAAARSFEAESGEDGAFSVDTGLESLPPEARLVAVAEEGGATLYSPSLPLGGSPGRELQVHLYPVTEDPAELRPEIIAVHDVVERDGAKRLRVRLKVHLFNAGEALYVGSAGPMPWREVLRVPLPAKAIVVRNEGPFPGAAWKRSSDLRWLIIDEPVPPVPDFGSGGGWSLHKAWEVEYLLPARQKLVLSYPMPFPLQPGSLFFYTLHEEMKVLSRELAFYRVEPQDPIDGSKTRADGTSRQFDVRGPGDRLPAGTTILAAVDIDNAAVGQISSRALKLHGGFVLLSILAILTGLLLGRKSPPPEAIFTGLGSEEVLDRIAELDRRFERGEIQEQEYRRYRDPLVEIAAEELQSAPQGGALSAGGPPPSAAGPSPASALPAAALGILARIRELEASGATRPEAIQERAHLLEALYKTLGEAEGGPKQGKERPR